MTEVAKLTPEESAKLDSFIGHCVRVNAGFELRSNRVGHSGSVGIQEVYNASIKDIETYGEFVYKASQNQGSPFASRKKPLLIGGKIPATELIDNLQLIIQEKEYNKFVESKEAEIAKLEKELDGMKSETEKKDELKARLASLKGENASSQVETAEVTH